MKNFNEDLARVNLASLPSRWANLCLDIEKTTRKIGVRNGDNLLLSISGGADSTALLIVFHLLRKRLDARLQVIHINHKLRPEAAQDAEFVTSLCHLLCIGCQVKEINVGEIAKVARQGLEEAGRKARHACLENARKELKAAHVLLGHHAGDLCEDVLLRLIRGAGWPAIGGMRAKEGFYLRPLLYIHPGELRRFLRFLNLQWREDASNQDLAFLRNRVRHRILPLLIEENPAFNRSITNLHNLARIDEAFWDDQLANALAKYPPREFNERGFSGVQLSDTLLHCLHQAGRIRLFHKYIKKLGINSGQTRADTVLKLEEAWRNKKKGKTFQFPGHVEASIKKDHCLLTIASSKQGLSNSSPE